MAKYSIEDTTLINIADAIRSKKNIETTTIKENIVGTKISKTSNATGFDSYSGSYPNGASTTDTITITGAENIRVIIAYQTEGTNYDYVTITPGVGTATDKLGGTSLEKREFDFPGTDTVSFYFKTDSGGNSYLGYYAEVIGYTTEEVEADYPRYTPETMAEEILALESSSSASFETPLYNCYLSANYVNDADIDGDINWTTFKSYIKDPVYNPTSNYTSSSGIGDGGTGLKYRLSGFTKMNRISSVDKIKSIYFWNAYHTYVWFAGMPCNKISDTIITMRACRIYYDSTYSRGYIKGVESDNAIGFDLQNNYFYRNFNSSISYYQMMIVYED